MKSAGGENDKQAHAKLIHQATGRRKGGLRLIDEMRQRGHAAYVNLDMAAVTVKAAGLPDNDVPPEIVRLLPLDKAHNELQPNKNATPVQGAVDYDEIGKEMACTRISGVVGEASSSYMGDDAARVRSVLQKRYL